MEKDKDMARTFPNGISQRPEGTLIVEEYHEGFNEIYFILHNDILKEAKLDTAKPELHKRLLLNVDVTKSYFEIFPINTLGSSPDFLKEKYSTLKSIVLEGFDFDLPENAQDAKYFLEELPSGFVKDFDYGLGLIKELDPFINTLAQFDIECLLIKNERLERAEIDTKHKICIISYSHFEKIRKELAKVVRNARSASLTVRRSVAHNLLSYFLDSEEYPPKPLKIQSSSLARLVAKDIDNVDVDLSKSDQLLTISIIEKNSKKIAHDHPERLLKLRNDIELVTLESLIEEYEGMLGRKLNEGHWQALFNANPFILSMAFGCPVIKIQDHASVGGRKLSGAGDKITDFLAKNFTTNNTSIIEIKTPQTVLTGRVYRDGVYAPSTELAGAVNQALDQKHKLQKNIAQIKEESRISDVETYSVHCVLIIGRIPNDFDKQKSFDMFRGNSKEVEIVTFDELLIKLKLLHCLLSEKEC